MSEKFAINLNGKVDQFRFFNRSYIKVDFILRTLRKPNEVWPSPGAALLGSLFVSTNLR